MKNPNWIPIVERKNSLLFQDFLIQGSSKDYFYETLNLDYQYSSNKYVDGRTSMSLDDMNQSSSVIAAEIEKNRDYYEKFAEKCYQQAEELIEESNKIGNEPDLYDLGDEEILSLFKKYSKKAFQMIPFLILANVVEFMFQDRLAAMLKEETKFNDDEIEYQLRNLVFPTQESLVAEDIRDMLEIGALIQENEEATELLQKGMQFALDNYPKVVPDIWKRIKKHVDRFAWMNTIGYLGEPMNPQDIIERLSYLVKRNCSDRLKSKESEKKSLEKNFNKTIKDLALSEDLVKLARIAGEYIHLRIYRMDALLIGHHNVRPLLREIAKRMGINLNDIIFLTYQEIVDFLKGKERPSENEIPDRKKGYALVMINREVDLYTGEDLERLKTQEPDIQEDYSHINILPGTSASLGEWIGTARIVTEPSDMHKIKEGDVLVSVMTTPDLILAMERSGAIVTDEGGMLCHAAIVSRELVIPCVIGTKTATRTIRDGDKIKVHAGELTGHVEILERQL